MIRKLFPTGRAGAALALAMLFELCLFADSHYRRWEEVIAPLNQPTANQGEGLVIRGNGLGYYAWLRSLLIDYDWDFANEFDDHPVAGDYVPPATYKTELGRRANQWSVGPACIWALFVVPGHYVLLALGDWSPWAADGYSLPYQLLVGAASLTTSFLGLLFLYRICLFFVSPRPRPSGGEGSGVRGTPANVSPRPFGGEGSGVRGNVSPRPSEGEGSGVRGTRAALAAILMTLGTTLIYYGAIEVSMAHGLAAAVLAGFVWYWLKTYGSLRPSRWLCVGLCLGTACLMRWQLATFAVLPAGEVLFLTVRTRDNLGKRLAGLTLTALGAFVAFVPQMVAWRCVYSHWLVEPIPQLAHHWLSPSLWDVLWSEDRSLFFWTPICALAFLGFLLPIRLPSPLWGRGAGGEGASASEPASTSPPSPLWGRGAGGEGVSASEPASTSPPSPLRGRGAGGEGASPSEPASLLLAAFALQAYALASVWGKGEMLAEVGNASGAFLSRAFGMRHLTEAVVALAPGLAILLERSTRTPFRLLCGLGLVMSLWNLLLVFEYSEGRLPAFEGVDLRTLAADTLRYVTAEPWLTSVLAEALALICMVLLWGNTELVACGEFGEGSVGGIGDI